MMQRLPTVWPKGLERSSEVPSIDGFGIFRDGAPEAAKGALASVRGRHSVSPSARGSRVVRHSGSGSLGSRSRPGLMMLLAVALAGTLAAQQPKLWLELRTGRQLRADGLTGSPTKGFSARVSGQEVAIAAGDLLAVTTAAARAPELLRVQLAGGDTLYGAIAGGDESGDALELLSPVLGKVAVPIDRLATILQHGVHAGDQRLPDGVDEAVFVPTGRGFDLVAGTLHRFGPKGISFQPDGVEEPRWFSPRRFSSLQLRGALRREQAAPTMLLTRTADRLGVTVRECNQEGVEVLLETGSSVRLRWPDVACLCFEKGVVHLSSLSPSEVVESGFEGNAVHRWRRDQCVVARPLLVQGRAYARGLGMHSKSRLSFVAPTGATHFRTRVAFDDSAAELPVVANAVCRVLKNGKLLFEVEDLVPGQAPRDAGQYPVDAGDTITLEVDFGRGRDIGDRIDWLVPVFLMRSRS